ncbi:hypothetical protein, partial [Pseudomonas aeruginosa]|uniref:hypothetical protein n=1 Tax=Pseudomonas aeruginosa TaxID=287 RepID=UPI0022390D12
AWTLVDSDPVNYSYLSQSLTLAAGQPYTKQLRIKKTVGPQSTYPVTTIEQGANLALVTIDTTNGVATAWTTYSGVAILPTSATCTDSGLFWLVSITTTLPVTAASNLVLYAAAAATPNKSSGVLDGTLQG